MKKFLTVILSALLALTVFTFVGCTNNREGSTTKINQWDYFDRYIRYQPYEYIEDNKDWSKNLIQNSAGETQPNCYMVFVTQEDDICFSENQADSYSDLNYYRWICVSRTANAKKITMSKFSVKIFAEADCEMKFSLSITGDTTPRASTTINATANTGTELLFENFAEYTWNENSTAKITVMIENPAEIGNIKFAFSNPVITLKK